MLVSEVLRDVTRLFNDKDYDRLSKDEYIDLLNAATRQVVLVRPDANAKTIPHQLEAGTRQAIPSDGFRLIDLVRNMGTDGETPGYPITLTDRSALDAANADWHTEAGADEIDNFVFDAKNPTVFYVTPPASTTDPVFVELVYSQSPDVVSDESEPIPLEDVFAGAVADWMLYLCYAMDDGNSDSPNKKLHHFQSFYQALGVELQSGVAISPDYGEDKNG